MAYPDFNMEHQWLPFTPNRGFAQNPRVFVAADGMHFTTHDGRQVLDAIERREAGRAEALMREHSRIARHNMQLAVRDPQATDMPGVQLIRQT